VASFLEADSKTVYDLSQVQIPMFSVDIEAEMGMPEDILAFSKLIDETDLIVISLAENNSSFNVGFKNLFDWTSRISGRKVFNGKPMLLLATSTGGRGGASVLESAANIFPRAGATILGTFSLPSFSQNFDSEKGITNEELLMKLNEVLTEVKKK
jgi:chromate reductase